LFGGSQGTKVAFDSVAGTFNITFLGINNVSLPLMTFTGEVAVTEVLDGNANNILAAVQFETDLSGAVRYPKRSLRWFRGGLRPQ